MPFKRVVVIKGDEHREQFLKYNNKYMSHGILIKIEYCKHSKLKEKVLVEFRNRAYRTNSYGKQQYPRLWYKREYVEFKTIWIHPRWVYKLKSKLRRKRK